MVLCLRYLPIAEDAQEVLMDGFCQVFARIGSFEYRGAGSLNAWMRKVMVNQCLMRLRKKKQYFIDADNLAEHPSVAVDDAMLDKLSAKELVQLIHTLPDGYRTVFNMYVFEEMGHKDIAAMLGISENTSKSQLYKARQLLQQKMKQRNTTAYDT